MRRHATIAAVISSALLATPMLAQDAPHQRQARQIFERLIGFRSAAGQGQRSAISRYIAETLRAGGIPSADVVSLPQGDIEALLVRIPGRDASTRPLLFSAHMDVVDARPEDWVLNPFSLTEKEGYFFGRGTLDNKAGVASLMSTILRMRAEGHHPSRTLLFAFIGDEESGMSTTRLVAEHAWAHNAEYAINTDAGGGALGEDGKPLYYLVQSAEKTFMNVRVVVTNPGGHSSWPRADNAIYDLARALAQLEHVRFPVMATPLTRAHLGTLGTIVPGREGDALRRFAADPGDADAANVLWSSPEYVGTTRTTCIPTLLEAGHASNALPQRAVATVNCRVFPGDSLERIRRIMTEAINDSTVQLEFPAAVQVSPESPPPESVMAAITKSIHARYPGIPVTPYLESGGTDGRVYRLAGIPTYASSGLFFKSSEMFAHGLNERIPVKSFYEAIEHIYELARELGGR